MQRALFDSLQTLRLERESKNGCVELCRAPDGTRWAKLRLTAPACQCECLAALGENVPVRLENGVLELLLPWREGLPLRQWLHDENPTLGQRRDACLALLEQQLELRGRLPFCLTILAAAPENLVNSGTGLLLQYVPDLWEWEPGMTEAQAVCALADVIYEVLVAEADWGPEGSPRRRFGCCVSGGAREVTPGGASSSGICPQFRTLRPGWAPLCAAVRGA